MDEPMIKRFLKRLLFWWVVTTYVGFGALAFAAGHLLLFAAAVVLLVPSFMTVFCAMYDNELED